MRPVFRAPAFARACIVATFPKLQNSNWSLKSPYDKTYRCIAYAACRTNRNWGPSPDPGWFWPESVTDDGSIESYVFVFSLYGYTPCDSSDYETGYQKVAIYAGADGVRHMARQDLFGRGWLSKLGVMEDIIHAELESIEGDPSRNSGEYGTVQKILRRSLLSALIHLDLFRCMKHSIRFWFYRKIRNFHGFAL